MCLAVLHFVGMNDDAEQEKARIYSEMGGKRGCSRG